MAIFTSGLAYTSLGYKTQFLPQYTTGAVIPASLPSSSDPRGIFSSGMVPSRSLSYRIVQTVSDTVRPSGSAILSSVPLFGVGGPAIAGLLNLPEVTFARNTTRTALLFFEGHDVIDLSTDGLERDGNAIIVPDLVYRVLNAGTEPFIKPGEDIAYKSALSFGWPPTVTSNLSRGAQPQDNAPVDVKTSAKLGYGIAPCSSRILVSGSPSFVSYVAIDKPLFRDVVTTRASVQAMGISTLSDYILTDTSFSGEPVSSVMRFVYINVAKGDDPPEYQWRLSESYGVDTSGKVEKAPAELVSSASAMDVATETLAIQNKHYVYNLNDDGPDTTDDAFCTPVKAGVTPLLAKAKMASSSKFYDKTFTAQALGLKAGYASSGTLTGPLSATVGPTQNKLNSQYMYTSPTLISDIGNKGRMGLEYSIRTTGGTAPTGSKNFVILARTVEATAGLTASYEDCVSGSKNITAIFDVSSLGQSMVERRFDEVLWAPNIVPLPDSKLGAFLLGEIPFESDGRAAFLPPPPMIDADISSDSVKLPAGSQVVSIMMALDQGSASDVLSLFDGPATADKDPLFEQAFAYGPPESIGSASVEIGTPAMSFEGFSRKGGRITGVFGFKKDDVLLEAMTGDKKSDDPSEFQLANVKELKFPIAASNPSACFNDASGATLVAYENEGRIDLAGRSSPGANWGIVRDVVMRIADDFPSTKDESEIPTATLPFLIYDPQFLHYMLFYFYKNRLLLKAIPIEIFFPDLVASETRRYSMDSEKSLSQTIQKLTANVVYDASGSGKTGEEKNNSIVVDLQFGNIAPPPDDPSAASSNPDGTATNKPKPVIQYCAFPDSGGYLYVMIQTEDRIVVKRACDHGQVWQEALPESFSFIPNGGIESPRIDGEAPFCLYDDATKSVCMFFFYQSCLMNLHFPSETLKEDSATAASDMSLLKPQVLIGAVTQDMIDRGITVQKSVEDIETGAVPPKLSPHRVAAVCTGQGYYRVFYKDDKQRLRSLISSNNGELWLTEKQFVG